MKLYRTQRFTHAQGKLPAETRFTTSLVKAKRVIEGDHIEIAECHISNGLTAADWIDILESDAPGWQVVNRTPVDFIESVEVVYTKGIERHGTG